MAKETVVFVKVQLATVESYVTVPGSFSTPEAALDAVRKMLAEEGLDDFIGADGAFIDNPIPVGFVGFAKGREGEPFVVYEEDAS